jgi:hypothetical protein
MLKLFVVYLSDSLLNASTCAPFYILIYSPHMTIILSCSKLYVFKAESLSNVRVNKFSLIYNDELISLTQTLTGNFELYMENLMGI